MATKRTMSSSAASSGSQVAARRPQALADLGHHRAELAVIMSTEKRSRIAPVRRWMASSTVIRPAVVGGDGAKALLEGGILRRRQRCERGP